MSMVSGMGQASAFGMVVLAEDVRPRVGTPEVRAEVERALTQLLKDTNSVLAEYENLRMLVVVPEPWSVENGFLTPTMKIRRNRIETSVNSQLATWYENHACVHWARMQLTTRAKPCTMRAPGGSNERKYERLQTRVSGYPCHGVSNR
jgi:hypothetical protein